MNALKLAKAFDTARLVVPVHPPDTAAAATAADVAAGCQAAPAGAAALPLPDESAASVYIHVLDAGKAEVQHTMTDPHCRFAACSCATATQQKMCHHQLAFLLQRSLAPAEAETSIFQLLGSRFGFARGCTFDSISLLWDVLSEQVPSRAAHTTRDPSAAPAEQLDPPQQPALNAAQSCTPAVHGSSAQPGSNAAAAATVAAARAAAQAQALPQLGEQASSTVASTAVHAVQACMDRFLAATPEQRHAAAHLISSGVARFCQSVDTALGQPAREGLDFQKGHVSFVRKQGRLEAGMRAQSNARQQQAQQPSQQSQQRGQAAASAGPAAAPAGPAAAAAASSMPLQEVAPVVCTAAPAQAGQQQQCDKAMTAAESISQQDSEQLLPLPPALARRADALPSEPAAVPGEVGQAGAQAPCAPNFCNFKHASELQSNSAPKFAHAWRGHKTAKQAAEHYAECIRHHDAAKATAAAAPSASGSTRARQQASSSSPNKTAAKKPKGTAEAISAFVPTRAPSARTKKSTAHSDFVDIDKACHD